MSAGVRNTVLGCLAFIALVLGAFLWSVLREPPPLSPEQLRAMGVYLLPEPRELEPFTLRYGNGETLDRNALQGHWTLAFFGFTQCPDICPTTMAELRDAYARLREQDAAEGVDVLMVSVDPDRDTPESTEAYVDYFHESFRGAAADRAATAQLAQQVNVAFARVPGPTPAEYLVEHSGQIVVFNPRGHYHAFMRMPHDAEDIALAVRALDRRFRG